MKNYYNKKTTRKMLVFFIISVAIYAFISGACIALEFTEIMFNPNGSDTGREWIEIKIGSECINFTAYKLYEAGTNHNIYSYGSDIACGYAIVCNDVEKFIEEHPEFNNHTTNDTTIYKSTFSLSNTGEELAIREDSEYLAYINYSIILSYVQVSEGYSLEYTDDAWRQSDYIGGTPGTDGAQQSYPINQTMNETINMDENITIAYDINATENDSINMSMERNTTDHDSNVTYYNDTSEDTNNAELDINMSDLNQTLNNTLNQTLNYTIEEVNNTSNHTGNNSYDNFNDTNNHNTGGNNSSNNNSNTENGTACSVSINITINNESIIYENGVQIKFYNRIIFKNKPDGLNYSIEYWVEDLEGTNFKSKVVTNNQAEKTFTPKIEESDKILIIKNQIKDAGQCTITVHNSEKMLLIRNPSYTAAACASTKVKGSADEDKKSECQPCNYDVPYTYDNNNKNCSLKPTMNVNVCNCTKNYQISQAELKQTNTDSKSATIQDMKYETEKPAYSVPKNSSMMNSQTTGMIVYESPNVKNRFYAIIGFLLVGLAFISRTGYLFFRKIITPKT
ncbi:MAG: hypothetical protein ACP5NW_04330 [Candidatus Woesearchaeota archaeon]